jgi:hypothetical protein
MNVTVHIPDGIAHDLNLDGPGAERRALEMFALEGYRRGEIGRAKVGELLGLCFYDTEAFLKENGAEIPLTLEEFHRSADALERLLSR